MFGTKTGSSIFKTEGLNNQFVDFQTNVREMLYGAETEHFTVDVVDGFKQAMRTQTKMLSQSGNMPWTKNNI